MRPTPRFLLALLGAATVALPASAHPLHGGTGLEAGLLHPLMGADHLLAALAIGFWASRIEGAKAWALPGVFLLGIAAGAVAGMQGILPGWMEAGIAASVLLLGLAAAVLPRLPMAPMLVAVAAFGALHGLAHGNELPEAMSPLGYGLGFLASTAAVHAVALLAARRLRWMALSGGAAVAAAGLVLLVG